MDAWELMAWFHSRSRTMYDMKAIPTFPFDHGIIPTGEVNGNAFLKYVLPREQAIGKAAAYFAQ